MTVKKFLLCLGFNKKHVNKCFFNTFYSSVNLEKCIQVSTKNITPFSTLIIIRNDYYQKLKPSNQYIRIISEDHVAVKIGEIMLKIQLYVTGINYILQYIFIENSYFKL